MKIILCGASGRMGKNVAELAKERGEEIVCGVDLSPAPAEFPIYSRFEDIKETADVVIDFSSARGLKERLDFCKTRNLPLLLAVTGYADRDERLISEYAEFIPIFKTGNLSLGVNVLQLLVKRAAQILGDDFDIEIIERHHNQKKDAPSGTALMLAESAEEGMGGGTRRYGREGQIGARPKREIGIHAVRGGNIVGEHEVMFAGSDEILTLSHSARSRSVFAAGALKAAGWLIGKPHGLYDMNHLFEGTI